MIIILFFYIIYLIYLTISSIFLLFYFWSSITMFFYSIFKNIFVYLNTKFNFINVKNVEIFNNKNCDSTDNSTDNSTNSFTDNSTNNSTINSTINSELNYDLNYNSKSNKNKLFHNTNYNTFEEIEIHQLSIYSNDYKEYTNYIYNNSDEMSRSIIWNY